MLFFFFHRLNQEIQSFYGVTCVVGVRTSYLSDLLNNRRHNTLSLH